MDLSIVTSDGSTKKLTVADKNELMVKRVVNKTDNPNPVIIFSMTILIILVMYFIYVYYIKESADGVWIAINNNSITIKYNNLTGHFKIIDQNERSPLHHLSGTINGNVLIFDNSGFSGFFANKKLILVNNSRVLQFSRISHIANNIIGQ